jgi:hypothetical protein
MIDMNKLFQNWHVLTPLQMTPWEWGFVIVGLSLTIWLIFWLRAYFREDADDKEETLEMLTQFRNLHQEGGLSDDEFRLIRSHLTKSAHKVIVGNHNTRDALSSSVERQAIKESVTETESQLPATHSSAGDEEKSERMTDEEKE